MIHRQIQGDVHILDMEGRFQPPHHQGLEEILQQLLADNGCKVICNMHNASYVSAQALLLLRETRQKICAQGGDLRICNTKAIDFVIQQSHLAGDPIFCCDLSSAMALLGKKPAEQEVAPAATSAEQLQLNIPTCHVDPASGVDVRALTEAVPSATAFVGNNTHCVDHSPPAQNKEQSPQWHAPTTVVGADDEQYVQVRFRKDETFQRIAAIARQQQQSWEQTAASLLQKALALHDQGQLAEDE